MKKSQIIGLLSFVCVLLVVTVISQRFELKKKYRILDYLNFEVNQYALVCEEGLDSNRRKEIKIIMGKENPHWDIVKDYYENP